MLQFVFKCTICWWVQAERGMDVVEALKALEALAWHIKHSITLRRSERGAANTKQGHKLYYRASCIWFRSQSWVTVPQNWAKAGGFRMGMPTTGLGSGSGNWGLGTVVCRLWTGTDINTSSYSTSTELVAPVPSVCRGRALRSSHDLPKCTKTQSKKKKYNSRRE